MDWNIIEGKWKELKGLGAGRVGQADQRRA